MKVTRNPVLRDVLVTAQEPKLGEALATDIGRIYTAFSYKEYEEHMGKIVECEVAMLIVNSLRGLYFQEVNHIATLVRPIHGSVYVVAVDLRPEEPTYRKHAGVSLNSELFAGIIIPAGFAYGYVVFDKPATVLSLMTEQRDPALFKTIAWNDGDLSIQWPLARGVPVMRPEDRRGVPVGSVYLGK